MIYHLLAAAHAIRAPWPVVVLVSCLPVITLGFGAALAHLLRMHPRDAYESTPETALAAVPEPVTPAVPERVPVSVRRSSQALSPRRTRVRIPNRAPERIFAAELEAGELPSIRAIKRRMSCSQDKAKVIRGHLAALLSDVPETIEAVS